MICATTVALVLTAAPSVTTADAARHLRADRAAYAAADADGDGRIDDGELEAVRRALAARNLGPTAAARRSSLLPRIGGHDRNGDGALTPEELYAEAR